MNTLDMIIAIRGGLPDKCDFCNLPYTEARYPMPEEAGDWACNECADKWVEQDKELRR